jgi:hypothetical protein
VLVWLSPQTTVRPGSGALLRPMTHDPDSVEEGIRFAPCVRMFASSVSTWMREVGSSMPAIPRSQPVVGVLWSAVATTESTRQTFRPASLSPSYACGLVTSWTRCRSM